MKKILSLILIAVLTSSIIACSGCSSSNKNNNALSSNSSSRRSSSNNSSSSRRSSSNNSSSSSSLSSSTKQQLSLEKFPCNSIDLSKFDKTKFDGKLKIGLKSTETSGDNKYDVISLPVKIEDIAKTYDTTKLYNYTVLPGKMESCPLSTPEVKGQEYQYCMYDLMTYNFSDAEKSAWDCVNNNWFGLDCPVYSKTCISDFINVAKKDASVTDANKQCQVLIDTLGNPSSIFAVGDSTDILAFYVYQYDKYVLVFKISECRGDEPLSGSFVGLTYLSTECYKTYVQNYKDDNIDCTTSGFAIKEQ